MCKILRRMWLLDESEVLPLLFQWWTGASPGYSFMEFPQWLSQRATWRSSPLDTLPFALDIRLSFVWSAPRLSLFHFPSRSMDFSCEARKGDVWGASLCAGVSEWLAANADSNNPPLNCFSGWDLQSCLVPAIKFWIFAKIVQALWTLASCRITGNLFLSSFRMNLVEILFILFHVWVVFCYRVWMNIACTIFERLLYPPINELIVDEDVKIESVCFRVPSSLPGCCCCHRCCVTPCELSPILVLF